eukprot:3495279-Rhodomonas_salina.2
MNEGTPWAVDDARNPFVVQDLFDVRGDSLSSCKDAQMPRVTSIEDFGTLIRRYPFEEDQGGSRVIPAEVLCCHCPECCRRSFQHAGADHSVQVQKVHQMFQMGPSREPSSPGRRLG